MTTTTPATRRQLVTCEAASELFAMDIASVERVLRYSAPSSVPNSAAWLRGVISHGTRLVPVIDLRERLGLPAKDVDARARIVVVTLEDGPLGVIVDAVHEVAAVDGASVEPPPAVYRGLSKDYVHGIVKRGERIFVLLDIARLVSSKERIEMQKAVESVKEKKGGKNG
jgi:purine-binding chemotaxis protein CheW